MYFTMVYGVLDKDSGCLRLAQAGHPAPILVRKDKPPEILGDGGFPLGMLPNRSFDPLEYQVEKGDRLFLCSDGILECTNFAGEEFGQERLMKVLNEHRQSSLDTLLRSFAINDASVGRIHRVCRRRDIACAGTRLIRKLEDKRARRKGWRHL